MEYALLVLYNGFQKLFNTLMNIEVASGVTVGGIFLAIIIISIIFTSFGFISQLNRSDNSGSYSRKDIKDSQS